MSKKQISFVLLFVGFFLCGKAQDKNVNEMATVYFMRATGAAAFGTFNTFIDDSLVCYLNNNCYSVHALNAGLHRFQVRVNGKKTNKNLQILNLELEANKKYYIFIDIKSHFYYGSISLLEITENSAKKMFASLKEDSNCK